MKAVVVYESMWGNTAAIARGIAEGLGGATRVMSTAEATPEALAGVDLIVAGAPTIAFNMTSEKTRPRPETMMPGDPKPDLSHPMMRTWLAGLPAGAGRFAAFDTRVTLPVPGTARKPIAAVLAALGHTQLAAPEPFYVTGKFGPLRDGEVERARAWGSDLAKAMG